jgi:hypothetical protein
VETRPISKEFLIASAMSALFVVSLTHYSSRRESETPSLPVPFVLLSEGLSESAGLGTSTKSPDPTQVLPTEPIQNGATLAETSGTSIRHSVHATSQAPDTVFDTNTPPQLEGRKLIAGNRVFTCYPSLSAVRQHPPHAWPSWTLRARGHEGPRCWYPGTHS